MDGSQHIQEWPQEHSLGGTPFLIVLIFVLFIHREELELRWGRRLLVVEDLTCRRQ